MAWIEYKEPVVRGATGTEELRIRRGVDGRIEVLPSPALAKAMGFNETRNYRVFHDSERPVIGLCVDPAGPYKRGASVLNLMAVKQLLLDKGCRFEGNVNLKPKIPAAKPGERLVVAIDYSSLLPKPA